MTEAERICQLLAHARPLPIAVPQGEPFTSLHAGLAILAQAHYFMGLHELVSNQQWSDPEKSASLVAVLGAVGWKPGWPYCAAFVEACWTMGYLSLGAPAEWIDYVSKRLNPSVMRSLSAVGVLAEQSIPRPGAIFFMQKGFSQLGHEGLIVIATNRDMATMEGNTAPGVIRAEADRDGDGLYVKVRRLAYQRSHGLHLRAIWNPPGLSEIKALLAGAQPVVASAGG